MRAACDMRGERMEVQCCISRCIPGFAARVSVGREGRRRRVPERTTNPSAVSPTRPTLAKTEQLMHRNAAV